MRVDDSMFVIAHVCRTTVKFILKTVVVIIIICIFVTETFHVMLQLMTDAGTPSGTEGNE